MPACRDPGPCGTQGMAGSFLPQPAPTPTPGVVEQVAARRVRTPGGRHCVRLEASRVSEPTMPESGSTLLEAAGPGEGREKSGEPRLEGSSQAVAARAAGARRCPGLGSPASLRGCALGAMRHEQPRRPLPSPGSSSPPGFAVLPCGPQPPRNACGGGDGQVGSKCLQPRP